MVHVIGEINADLFVNGLKNLCFEIYHQVQVKLCTYQSVLAKNAMYQSLKVLHPFYY